MTTFCEAARALAWGRDLLEDLVADPLAHPSERDLAAELLVGYPTTRSISGQLEDLDGHNLMVAASCIHQTRMLVTRLTVGISPALAERAQRIAWHFPRVRALDAATPEDARTWAAHELNRRPGRYGLVSELARKQSLDAFEAQARVDGWIDEAGLWCSRPGEEASR